MPLFGVSVTPSAISRSKSFWVSVTLCGILSLVIFLGGCKETDSDKIADAQECLDRYAREGSGDLTKCEEFVTGLNSRAAHGIRCATGFIREGIGDAQTLINAFAGISTVTGSSVQTFLDAISFKSAGTGSTNVDTNYVNAQTVYGSCTSSYAKGATMIAAFSYLTTVLYNFSCDTVPSGAPFQGNCNMDSNALAGAIAYGIAFPGTSASMLTDLGNIVVNTDTVSCSTGATNEKLCEFLGDAISNAGGSSNKALVGQEFLNVLANLP